MTAGRREGIFGVSAGESLAVNAPGTGTKGRHRQPATDHGDALEEQPLLNHLHFGRNRPVGVKEKAGHQREEGQHQRGKAGAETHNQRETAHYLDHLDHSGNGRHNGT